MISPLTPVVLTGQHVELQPISREHHDDLCAAVAVDELWRLTVTTVPSPSAMRDYLSELARDCENGRALPFAIVDRKANRAVGSTRFMNIRRPDHGLEIGGTWLGVPWQRTAINT